MLQIKFLQDITTIITRAAPVVFMCIICLVSANCEASTQSYSSQTLTNPTIESDRTKLHEICYQVNGDDYDRYNSWQAFLNDIGFTPIVTNNVISAYKITNINEGSLFSHVGLEFGDEITHLNNRSVRDTEYLITALSQIKVGATLKISIMKNQDYMVNYIFLFNPLLSCSDT